MVKQSLIKEVIIDGETFVKVPKLTRIHFLLDKSFSMYPNREATLSAFNEYIGSLKADKNKYQITLTLFDHKVTTLWENENLSQVKPLTEKVYARDMGNTALFDAVVSTLKAAEEHTPAKNLVVILTDGEENSSKKYTQEDFKKIKSRLEEKGNWTFVFLGANQDAWLTAQAWGYFAQNVSSFNVTPSGVRTAGINLASSTMNFAGSAMASTDSFMTEKQQKENESTK